MPAPASPKTRRSTSSWKPTETFGPAARVRRWLCIGVCAVLPYAAGMPVALATVVELSSPAEKWVDRGLVKRLIELELSDVEVPPPPGAESALDAPGLYVRVLRVRGRIVVELWDRGERKGQRRLSPSESRVLTARRIALASGELALRLRDQRLAEQRAYRLRQRRLAGELARPKPPMISARPFFSTELAGGVALDGGLALWGPRMRGGLTLDNGSEVLMGAALGNGTARELHDSPALEWFEFSTGAGYWFGVDGTVRWRLGADAALATVHFLDATVWSEAGSARETWTARGTGQAKVSWAVSRSVRLDASLEAGAILRRMWLRAADGEREGIGGLWLGAGVGVTMF